MRTTLLIACCFVAAAAFAQSSLTSDPNYEKQCAKCHGKDAGGRHFGGPALATTQLSLDEVKAVIENGRKRMPAYKGKLTDDQISTLATEMKDLSKK
jgi:mono/diheme cytochrome c family protein